LESIKQITARAGITAEVMNTNPEQEEEMLTNPCPNLRSLNSRAIVDGVPELYAGSGFKNFKCRDGFENKINTCLNFAHLKTKKKSLVLYGNSGNGKTHLAISILKNLPPKINKITVCKRNSYVAESGEYIPSETHEVEKLTPRRGIVLIADEFFQKLNDSVINHMSKIDLIAQFLAYDMALLDDIDSRNLTPAKLENLYMFINRAAIDKRAIIITTNLDLKELAQIDYKIYSRLLEIATFVKFSASDYRQNFKD